MKENLPSQSGPVLFFDSGIGGLSVLAAARSLIPDLPVVYAADYAGMPYGMKSEAELATRIPILLGRLVERYQPRLVTIACNTASTIALDHVRSALNVPVVGTVPAVKPAAEISKTRVVGLLGTTATIRQPYVDRLAEQFASDVTLLRHGAPELVHAAEEKLCGQTPDPRIFYGAISGLTQQKDGDRIDVIILACTHFPLVQDELAHAFGRPVTFVDGAAGIARRIRYLLKDDLTSAPERSGVFVTTGDLASVEAYRPKLHSLGLETIERL
jgi:glutamate racemase